MNLGQRERDALELMVIGIPDEDAVTAAGLPASSAPRLRRLLDQLYRIGQLISRQGTR